MLVESHRRLRTEAHITALILIIILWEACQERMRPEAFSFLLLPSVSGPKFPVMETLLFPPPILIHSSVEQIRIRIALPLAPAQAPQPSEIVPPSHYLFLPLLAAAVAHRLNHCFQRVPAGC